MGGGAAAAIAAVLLLLLLPLHGEAENARARFPRPVVVDDAGAAYLRTGVESGV